MKTILALAVLTAVSVQPAAAQDVKVSDVVRTEGSQAFKASRDELIKLGQSLFLDKKLSTNDMSCNSCHADLQAFNDTFRKPYPHMVQMALDMAKLNSVSAETMVQFCMIVPMAAKPLGWESRELAALTAYVEKLQTEFTVRK